jgi:hypothetical protein
MDVNAYSITIGAGVNLAYSPMRGFNVKILDLNELSKVTAAPRMRIDSDLDQGGLVYDRAGKRVYPIRQEGKSVDIRL